LQSSGPAGWDIDSWKARPIQQQPVYADAKRHSAVLDTIRNLPPLVAAGEVDALKQKLADAAVGKRFVLQGGDCAERFQDCRPDAITNKLKIILQMSVILSYGSRRPVIRIGRIAGQFAKPRSADIEEIGGVKIPSYRGDNINSFEATAQARQPDPERLLQSYHQSSLTLNYIRALIVGGFADLHHPQHWNLSALGDGEQKRRYEKIVANIQDAIDFMEALGGVKEETLGSIDFYTSHEGLLLAYESALTRFENGKFYNLGAHMLWIGERTRDLNGAHIEYFRGIANPIAVKLGPNIKAEEVIELTRVLNPANEVGKLTLISRMGADRVQHYLPKLVEAVRSVGASVVWSCDPMHGNTIKTDGDIKTRSFDDILRELRQTFEIHRTAGTHLGGVHFEMTGENVTECIGGSEGIRSQDLSRAYETYCDPRLNYSQSLEMAFLISSFLHGRDDSVPS
jgi:3-deoxy-7-phosphoheptulonate synthase